jgi:hypothetical protein
MGHSQIAAFARLANGNVAPSRNIFGQNTMITRSIHKFAYDPVKDEIVVPHFQSQAILFFRGGADGDEAPVRTIKGPDVKLPNTDQLTIDSVHREIFIGVYNEYPRREFVAVYSLDADGNVPPLRILEGPDTGIGGGRNGPGVTVDPVTNRLFVSGTGGKLLIFNRTDSGNVKPRAYLRNPEGSGPGAGFIYPEKGLLFSTVGPRGSFGGEDGGGGRGGPVPAGAPPRAPAGVDDNRSYGQYSESKYIGVWSVNDTGDVAPRWKIAAPPNGPLRDPVGTVVVDPKRDDVYIPDRYTNAIYVYHVPEIFK